MDIYKWEYLFKLVLFIYFFYYVSCSGLTAVGIGKSGLHLSTIQVNHKLIN